ncbi:penicillin-binding transpeptidase domain-containing protein [Winogradskyella sp. 3972H.M.0a.05]|uniref:penicillin-binding protein n=1 Tax=Winogradskyella sp. 3972H.M.0a.05 TaxID=2950277 RepID=UPI0033937FD0
MFVFVLAVVFKLMSIQFIQGDKYRSLAEQRTVKNVEIPANRGNVYAADGSLLATSVPKYDIRLDALTPSTANFEDNVKSLSDSLSRFLGKSSGHYEREIRKARTNKNRYFLLARNLSYTDYIRFRNFPLLSLGAFKGGLIVEQKTKREHPMGGIAHRAIGYERFDEEGNVTRAGIDGAFGEKYLRGKNGHRMKQKIGNGQWKPIRDNNEVEPQDGYDIYTTIDANIQDIAHHALLEQLEYYEADHGCVVVMETNTGEIRAISNLGRTEKGTYYEKRNYAVWESHEPGSTFKLMALAVALEDKVIDTSDVVDTQGGILSFYGNKVRDSRRGGYGKITVSKAFEVSSNTGIVKTIDKHYGKNPKKFVDGLYDMDLHEQLDLPILGEGKPIIPDPRVKNGLWSGIALQWMAYGYNVKMTPLQTLTFYNAIANGGEMLRPRFLREVKEYGNVVESFDKEVINKKICSEATVKKLQQLLKNVVEKKHGTGYRLHSENFSMAGKTGTAQTEYWMKDWSENKRYVSSFAGYFPAENPKYSCIVVIHKPSVKKGYYGADVSGPVFKKIAQKIYTDTPLIDEVKTLAVNDNTAEKSFENYFDTAETFKTIMPNVKGMPTMDAMALLENMGLKVRVSGVGIVKEQSIAKGVKVKKNQTVELTI